MLNNIEKLRVEALEGAGDPGKGTEGGPEVDGPVKLLGGMLKGCEPEDPLDPEKEGTEEICPWTGPGEGLFRG